MHVHVHVKMSRWSRAGELLISGAFCKSRDFKAGSAVTVDHTRIGLTSDDASAKAEALAEEEEEKKAAAEKGEGGFLGGIFGQPAAAPARM